MTCVSAFEQAEQQRLPPEDIGPASTGEAERLRARVDELQAETRQLQIKITGLESEVEELKGERDQLRGALDIANRVSSHKTDLLVAMKAGDAATSAGDAQPPRGAP